MRVGIFGGTFNPVHFGHLRAAEEVREYLCLDQVLIVPAGTPPLKSAGLADAALRVEMARLATAGNPGFKVLDIEAVRPGPSFTIDTLLELSSLYRDDDPVFILGADAFADLPKWKRSEDILCAVDFCIVCRPGVPVETIAEAPYIDVGADLIGALGRGESLVAEGRLVAKSGNGRKAFIVRTTAMGISATEIRRRLASGRSVSYLLPESVKSFIITNGLYCDDK